MWSKFVAKQFSRSETNKFALSMFEVARELFGAHRGGILFHCLRMFLVTFQSRIFEVRINFIT